MANESVVDQSREEVATLVPGFRDLLIDVETADNPERIADAANNLRDKLLLGLSGVGSALAAAAIGKCGISDHNVAAVGWLVEELATCAMHLDDLHNEANYRAQRIGSLS